MARKQLIRSLDEIPSHFASEAEEQAFWDAHDISITLLDSLPEPPAERRPPVRARTTAADMPSRGETALRGGHHATEGDHQGLERDP